MINATPSSPLLDLATSIKILLMIIFIIILIVGSTYLMLKARKIEFKTTKRVLQGYASFGFCFSATRVFFLISTYEGRINPQTEQTAFYNNIAVVSAYAVTMASIVFIFLVVERFILVHKPVFATIALISFCVDIVALVFTFLNLMFGTMSPKDLANFIQTALSPILGLAICVLYIIIIRNSAGSVKRKAIETFVGVFLLLLGIVLDISAFDSLLGTSIFNAIRLVTTPALFIIGVLIVFHSIK